MSEETRNAYTGQTYHCSCGAACTAEEYIDHLLKGHDTGQQPPVQRARDIAYKWAESLPEERARFTLRELDGLATRIATLAYTGQQQAADTRAEIAAVARRKAMEYREQAERWQRNAEQEVNKEIKDLNFGDRDSCLNKMAALVTFAIELESSALTASPKAETK